MKSEKEDMNEDFGDKTSKTLPKFKDYKEDHPEIYARMVANFNPTGKNPFFPNLQLDMVDWKRTEEGEDFWEDVYDGRFEDAYNYIKYHGGKEEKKFFPRDINEQLRMQVLAGIITENQYKRKLNENEIWDKDVLNRDTYSDTSYEDNWDDNQDFGEEEYSDAEIVNKEYSQSNGTKKVIPTLIDEFGEEYEIFEIFNTKQEINQALKDSTYGQIEGFFNLNNGKVAVAFPSQSSKGEDFGGM